MLTQLEKFDLKDILLLPQTNNKHILSPSFIKAPLCIVAIGQQRPLVNDCTTLHQLAVLESSAFPIFGKKCVHDNFLNSWHGDTWHALVQNYTLKSTISAPSFKTTKRFWKKKYCLQ